MRHGTLSCSSQLRRNKGFDRSGERGDRFVESRGGGWRRGSVNRRRKRGLGIVSKTWVLRAMSAGLCGKRVGLDEIVAASPAPAPTPAPKRARCCSPSPTATTDLSLLLLRMFPSMDRHAVETILDTHDHNIEDAIKSLHALCLGNDSAVNELASLRPDHSLNVNTVEGGTNASKSDVSVEDTCNGNSDFEYKMMLDRSSWVDLCIQEMMNARDWDDVRGRGRRFLEAFEKTVHTHSAAAKEHPESASLKEQVQCLLRDNQILKKAVAIQHERNLENEEKLKEVQQLKHIISQYQEQLRTLELNNYSLNIHLQRAREGNSIPGPFHPDVF